MSSSVGEEETVLGRGNSMLECLQVDHQARGQDWECKGKSNLWGKDPDFSFVHIKAEVSLGRAIGAAGVINIWVCCPGEECEMAVLCGHTQG